MDYRNDVGYEAERTATQERDLQPVTDLLDYLREYAREHPEVTALTCFCIGFVLGWKLKPW